MWSDDADEGIFSDLSLEANDGAKFKAHKNIFAARSPVFAAMLKHDMREAQESIVRIEDFNGDTLRTMLEFIYTSGFKKKQCNLIELMAAADKYALDLLKAMCEQECLKNLNIENAASYLFSSDQHQAITLKKHSLDFIQIHHRSARNRSFSKLIRDFKRIMIDSVKLQLLA
ncbi:speckle-type POZ protein-like [Copidosoma floridanum]|uniref:speckle-type POZ protein-like n=1 Tax=Copidosoma floridanum TaxID=29053 RepID=UPI0006C95F5C|nr:speckle-type POZ protein-like [Copidosoma floridanum]